MVKNQPRFTDVVKEIRRLRDSDQVKLALQEKAMLSAAREQLDKLQSLYDRGQELMDEGLDSDLLRALLDE